MIDGLAAGRPAGALIGLAAGLAAAGLGTAGIPLLANYLQSELRRRIDREMRERLAVAVGGFDGLSRFEDPRFVDQLRMATRRPAACWRRPPPGCSD